MAVTRNLKAEQLAVGAFRAAHGGKLPDIYNNPEERAQVYKIAYPPSAGGLPEELKGTVDESLYGGGTITPQSANVAKSAPMNIPQGEASNITQLAGNVETARAAIEGPYSATARNEYGRVLQDAIRRSTGYTADKVKLGESELFKKAGMGGYNVLSQSLSSHANEMINSAGELERILNDLTGAYKSTAEDAFNKYKTSVEEYQFEADRLSKIAERTDLYKQQALMQKRQQDAERENIILKYALDNGISFNDARKAVEATATETSTEIGSYEASQIAQAIKQHETGGVARAGATGEMASLYQWLPDTWKTISSEYAAANGIKQSIAPTPENEDKVATWKIQQLLDRGFNAKEVAMIWNTSLGGEEKPLIRKGEVMGTAGKPVKYDSEAYANSVLGILQSVATPTGTGIAESPYTMQELTSQYNSLRNKLPTVNDREYADKVIRSYKASNDVKGLNEYLDDLSEASLKGTLATDYTGLQVSKVGLQDLLNEIDGMMNVSVGPYKDILESSKPWTGREKDQRWIELMSRIEENQAKYRNSIYGASLTKNELTSSLRFMIDPAKDDIKTIETKLRTMTAHADLALRVYLDVGRGTLRGKASQKFSEGVREGATDRNNEKYSEFNNASLLNAFPKYY